MILEYQIVPSPKERNAKDVLSAQQRSQLGFSFSLVSVSESHPAGSIRSCGAVALEPFLRLACAYFIPSLAVLAFAIESSRVVTAALKGQAELPLAILVANVVFLVAVRLVVIGARGQNHNGLVRFHMGSTFGFTPARFSGFEDETHFAVYVVDEPAV